jgi:hypothetical protein
LVNPRSSDFGFNLCMPLLLGGWGSLFWKEMFLQNFHRGHVFALYKHAGWRNL